MKTSSMQSKRRDSYHTWPHRETNSNSLLLLLTFYIIPAVRFEMNGGRAEKNWYWGMETRRCRIESFRVTREQAKFEVFFCFREHWIVFLLRFRVNKILNESWSLMEFSCFRIASRKGLLIRRKTVFIFLFLEGSSFDNCCLVKLFTERYWTLFQANRRFQGTILTFCKSKSKVLESVFMWISSRA